MESVDGISRPAAALSGGAGLELAPSGYLPVEYAPLLRKGLRAVSPQPAARLFHIVERLFLPCMRGSSHPW